jgi:hypothetical protein
MELMHITKQNMKTLKEILTKPGGEECAENINREIKSN